MPKLTANLCAILLLITGCSTDAVRPRLEPPPPEQSPSRATRQPLPTRGPTLETVRVAMRDGVGLATDFYLPEGAGPWPAVLTRTPYGKHQFLNHSRRLNALGYAVIVQDTRGRFDSEGKADIFFTDGWGDLADGYDTVEWVALQPWCNGKVGMTGASAMGITQYLAAGSAPPHLVVCDVAVACASQYHHAAYPGGAFGEALVKDWLTQNGFPPEVLDTVRSHRTYDSRWRVANLEEVAGRVQVPMRHFGGWYDVFQQGTIDAFTILQHSGGEGARGRQRLIMGPWAHGGRPEGELDFPPQAAEHPREPSGTSWLARWLHGEPNGAFEDTPPVQYYTMGACGEPGAPGNKWRSADDWPVPAASREYFLQDGGTLGRTPPVKESRQTFSYDPRNPVPTLGGCNLTISRGPMDQSELESRPDVLVFTTEVLTAPLEVTGRVLARLWVSSTAPDTDFTVKLTDVYPDGRSMLVCDGIRRARFRNSFTKPELMRPGDVYALEVDLWSTSIVFNAGHRIRLAVSSSNYPRFEPNPNTAGGPGSGSDPAVARNSVHLGGEAHASRVILPVVTP